MQRSSTTQYRMAGASEEQRPCPDEPSVAARVMLVCSRRRDRRCDSGTVTLSPERDARPCCISMGGGAPSVSRRSAWLRAGPPRERWPGGGVARMNRSLAGWPGRATDEAHGSRAATEAGVRSGSVGGVGGQGHDTQRDDDVEQDVVDGYWCPSTSVHAIAAPMPLALCPYGRAVHGSRVAYARRRRSVWRARVSRRRVAGLGLHSAPRRAARRLAAGEAADREVSWPHRKPWTSRPCSRPSRPSSRPASRCSTTRSTTSSRTPSAGGARSQLEDERGDACPTGGRCSACPRPPSRRRSKDLQVAAWLTEALTRTYGFPGLRDGLRVLRGPARIVLGDAPSADRGRRSRVPGRQAELPERVVGRRRP